MVEGLVEKRTSILCLSAFRSDSLQSDGSSVAGSEIAAWSQYEAVHHADPVHSLSSGLDRGAFWESLDAVIWSFGYSTAALDRTSRVRVLVCGSLLRPGWVLAV